MRECFEPRSLHTVLLLLSRHDGGHGPTITAEPGCDPLGSSKELPRSPGSQGRYPNLPKYPSRHSAPPYSGASNVTSSTFATCQRRYSFGCLEIRASAFLFYPLLSCWSFTIFILCVLLPFCCTRLLIFFVAMAPATSTLVVSKPSSPLGRASLPRLTHCAD